MPNQIKLKTKYSFKNLKWNEHFYSTLVFIFIYLISHMPLIPIFGDNICEERAPLWDSKWDWRAVWCRWTVIHMSGIYSIRSL